MYSYRCSSSEIRATMGISGRKRITRFQRARGRSQTTKSLAGANKATLAYTAYANPIKHNRLDKVLCLLLFWLSPSRNPRGGMGLTFLSNGFSVYDSRSRLIVQSRCLPLWPCQSGYHMSILFASRSFTAQKSLEVDKSQPLCLDTHSKTSSCAASMLSPTSRLYWTSYFFNSPNMGLFALLSALAAFVANTYVQLQINTP